VKVENTIRTDLGIVVPITKMYGRLSRLESWLVEAISSGLSVYLIHDKQDDLTGPDLQSLISRINSPLIRYEEGVFGGPGQARNKGLELAINQWIMFWDSDDFGDVQELMKIFKDIRPDNFKEIDLIIANFSVCDEVSGNEISKSRFGINNALNFSSLVLNTGLWRCIFRRKSITQKFPGWKMAEDQYFLLHNLNTEKTMFRQEVVYNYFINVENQLTSNKRAIDELTKSIKNFEDGSDNVKNRRLIKQFLIRQATTLILHGSLKGKARGLTSLSRMVLKYPSYSVSVIYSALINREFRLDSKNSKSTKIALMGGLGNQLFQMAAGLSQSTSGKIQVEMPLSSSRLNNRGEPDIFDFDFPFEIQLKKIERNKPQLKRILNLSLRLGISQKKSAKIKFVQAVISIVSSCLSSMYFRELTWVVRGRNVGFTDLGNPSNHKFYLGYFQSYRYLAENNLAYEKFSRMKLKSQSQEVKGWIDKIQESKPLVVHIRLGDYLFENDFGIVGKEYYRRALEICDVHKTRQPVWIFSDDIKMAKEMYGEIFSETAFWFSDSKLTSVETLEVMRNGKAFVIANSTFSWWAAFLAYDSSGLVIAPSQWFRSLPSPEAILPEDWIQIMPDFMEFVKKQT
jgi:hypothetical protein